MSTAKTDMILEATKFAPSDDIIYAKPVVNKAGGKSVRINNKHNNRQLHLSMPLMLTWGVNARKDEQTGRESFDMSLQFPKEEYANEQTTAVLAAIEAMEEQVKNDAITNSKEWFNKAKLTSGQVDVLFNPMLYWPKDNETGERREGASPTLRVKLDYWDEKFKCEIYDVEQNPLYGPMVTSDVSPVDLIPKGCQVATIIKCGGVYFVNGKFGITWRLHQALVKPKTSITGKCFISLTPDEVSLLNAQPVGESDTTGERVEVVESEGEEGEEEDKGEPEPVVPPPEPESVVPPPAPEPVVPPEPAAPETDGKKVKKRVVRRKE